MESPFLSRYPFGPGRVQWLKRVAWYARRGDIRTAAFCVKWAVQGK